MNTNEQEKHVAHVAHVMAVMGKAGDTQVVWHLGNETEIKTAAEQFEQMCQAGYNAYRTGENGGVMTEFDPTAEKIVLAPRMAGG